MSRKKHEQARVGVSLVILFGLLGLLAIGVMRDSGTTSDYPADRPVERPPVLKVVPERTVPGDGPSVATARPATTSNP